MALLKNNTNTLKTLAKIIELTVDENIEPPQNAATGMVGKIKFFIPLGIIDIDKERKRILDQIEQQKKNAGNLSKRLKNENFVNKAPKDVVAKEKARLALLENKIHELEQVIQNLQS